VIAQADIPNFGPLLEPYREFWTDYARRASDTARQMFQTAGGADLDPRTWQRRWLQAVSASMDAYLRSPAFLHAMKQNMDMMIKAKLQADDFTKEFARNANLPTASDVTGLFARLRSLEDAILSKLAAVDRRLEAIEARGKAESSV
jgi:hypothetical protein